MIRNLILPALLFAVAREPGFEGWGCGGNEQIGPPQPDANMMADGPMGMPDAAPFDGSPDARPFISQPANTLHEEETTIAADGQGMVVGAWIGFFPSTSTNGYAVSRDDGMTWEQPKQIDSPGGRWATDPALAVDASGNFYLSWIGFSFDAQGNPTDSHIYASRLDRTMGQFGSPVDVSAGTAVTVDKPWITAIDGGSKVMITWAELSTFTLYGAVSTNQGITWTRNVVRSGSFANLAYPCTDPTTAGSPVYVTFITGAGGNLVNMRKSTDNGVTWTNQASVATDAVYQDPTCAVRGNNVWVMYAQGTNGGNPGQTTDVGASVKIVHSTDGASTFAAAVRVTDSTSTDVYLFPQLARAANGNLHAVFYQGGANGPATLVHAVSTNAGTSWTRNMIAMPGTLVTNRTPGRWLGDYLGVFPAGSGIYVDYGNNSSADQKTHVLFTRLPQ